MKKSSWLVVLTSWDAALVAVALVVLQEVRVFMHALECAKSLRVGYNLLEIGR